jgi:hypothetical protein
VVSSQKYERLVIVRADDAPPLTNIFESETALTVGSTAIVTQAVHNIWHDAIVNRYLHGVFPVTMRAHSLEHVMLGDFGGKTLRIAAWPKALREQLLEGLKKNTTCVLDPKTCTHVLCVVDAYNRLHVGLMPNEDHYNHVNDLEIKGSSSSSSNSNSKKSISSSEESSTNEDSNSIHDKGKGVKTKDKGGDITRAAYKLTELMLNVRTTATSLHHHCNTTPATISHHYRYSLTPPFVCRTPHCSRGSRQKVAKRWTWGQRLGAGAGLYMKS